MRSSNHRASLAVLLGLLGVWIGVTAGLALGFYALLQTFG